MFKSKELPPEDNKQYSELSTVRTTWGNRSSISGTGNKFFSSPSCPYFLWGPPSQLCNGYREFFPQGASRCSLTPSIDEVTMLSYTSVLPTCLQGLTRVNVISVHLSDTKSINLTFLRSTLSLTILHFDFLYTDSVVKQTNDTRRKSQYWQDYAVSHLRKLLQVTGHRIFTPHILISPKYVWTVNKKMR